MIKRLFYYLNPIAHLGDRNYSISLSLAVNIAISILSEIFAYGIAKNPMIVGAYIIFVNVALIIYFAFREGIPGGFIASGITILYYIYIIYTRHYSGDLLSSGIDTTLVLAFLYFFLSGIIGWLKQTIDKLIEQEANEKRRLQAIMQQLPVGILVTDHNGKIVQSNKQVELILGKKRSQRLLVGEDITENTNEKSSDEKQWPLVQSLATGKSIVGKEFTIEREDKKRIYIQVSASAIRNKDGKTIAAASIINDITQQKEMEERKDDFVNMASHELKTPITSMKLYLDSLMSRIKKYDDERAIKTLNSIKGQTERLQELVNDLLDVSRLQTGKLGFTKEELRIDSLIEETIEGLQASTKKQKIIYTKKSPITLYADKFRLYQVITNLITNAIKYSPEGKDIIVEVKKKGEKAVVSVQDFGIGIAKEQQKKIFERLYQVTDSTEKTFPGFGMGLYISKEIVKKHRGNIWVKSEKGKGLPAGRQGSTFYFTLPISKKKI